MQRQRGELVPIGEVVGGLDGPVKAIREASPQARHHFTQADQLNQLATARIADPNLAFAAVVSAAFLAPAGWWPEAPSSETAWNILAILVAALIAAGAAIFAARWASRSTMKNACELQYRERRHEEKSVAALPKRRSAQKIGHAGAVAPGAKRFQGKTPSNDGYEHQGLEAALPKLGGLDHQGAANLLAAFEGIALLVSDAREARQQGLTERMQCVALHIGRVVNTLWGLYDWIGLSPSKKRGLIWKKWDSRSLRTLGYKITMP